jgi:hypothetical protein
VKGLLEVPLSGGEVVPVEIEVEESAIRQAARPGQVVAAAAETLESALGRLRAVADAFVRVMDEVKDRPNGVTVEFGVKVSAEAGLVVAHTGGEGHFVVTLQWSR